MIQDLVDELTLLASDRRMTLSFESQSVPAVFGDAQWLTQALINLLDNALHYTPSGGAVTVRLQAVGEEVTVVVEDTGHGIEPGHLPHLFERFYRTDWVRAKDSGGTGLGLAIIKEIVEAMAEQFRSQAKSTRARSLPSVFRPFLIRQFPRRLSGLRIHSLSCILL
jgi:signal transduction histidine kinase